MVTVLRRSRVPFTLALVAIGAAFFSQIANTTAAHGPSCPLPVGRQVKAIKAFLEMMPVFQHPRCFNCHGGVNPFIEKTGPDPADTAAPASTVAHGGGLIRRQNDRAPDGTALIESECRDCHNNMARRRNGSKSVWMTAPNFLSFVGKDATAICKQVKLNSHDAKHLIGHMTDDNGGNNFTKTAFDGYRGLEPDRYENIRREAPSISHQAFIQLGQKWVAAMGGELVGDQSCGCEMPGIKLEVHHTQLLEGSGGPGWREFSEAKFEVRLPPVGDRLDAFAAEHSLTRQIQMTVPRPCTATAARDEVWELQAKVDSAGTVRVQRSLAADEPVGKVVCRYPQGTGEMELFPSSEGVLSYGELVFPPDSTSRTLRFGREGYQETLTIRVLEVPGK
jgi:hypothetical protein